MITISKEMRTMRILTVLLAVIIHFSPIAYASWILDLDAGMKYDDNASNASSSKGKNTDLASVLSLSVGQYLQVADYTGVSATVDLRNEASINRAGLNQVSTGLSVAANQKLGLGPEAVRVNLYGSLSNDDYYDAYRSSVREKAGISASRWFGESVKVGLGYEYDRRLSKNQNNSLCGGLYLAICNSSDVYNLQGNSGMLSGTILVAEKDTLFLSYRYRSGTIASSDYPSLKALNSSTAVSPDSTFGGLYAYRISGATQTVFLGISHELARKISLNFTYLFSSTAANGGNDYQGNVVNFSLSFSL